MIYTITICLYMNGIKIKKKLYEDKLKIRKPIYDNLILNGNVIPQSSVVVKKTCKKNWFIVRKKKDFIAWEDFDLWIKISKITDKFYYINKNLGFYWVNNEKFIKLKTL